MFTVALIGPDGAGKTTIARMLENDQRLRSKYLYMGINIESSNVSLPTSRFIQRMKNAQSARRPGTPTGQKSSASRRLRSSARSLLRLCNRVAEEIYRQALASRYRRKGFIVVYDRHFKFDFEAPSHIMGRLSWSERIHRLWLAKLYPSPDLVIFLDAPAELLYARKHEASVAWLEERRTSILRQGNALRNFIRVDATNPIERVYSDVYSHIERYRLARQSGRPVSTDEPHSGTNARYTKVS